MKFSILIANYNNGKFFRDCYESIISQTYTDWEAVILDDCSTDDSVAVIEHIISGNPKFRLYKQTENSGVGVVKSKLIDLSQGDICCYLDPDDTITTAALHGHAKALSAKPQIVLTYSRLVKCDENLKPVSEFKSAMQVPNGDKNFFNCPVQIAPLVCFRKDVYMKTDGVNRRFRIAEDQDLYLKMYEKGPVKFINQTDYMYRAHSGGISQNDNKPESYEYFAECIFEAMKRRNLKSINGVAVPAEYPGSEKIFDMLQYQNKIPYRIKKKIRLLLQKII